MMTARRGVAIFDLDGTLTYFDSYLAYLFGFLFRNPRRVVRIVSLPWVVLRYSVGRLNNTALKEHFLEAIMGGASRREVESWTSIFVDHLLARGLRRMPCGQ